MNNCINGIKVLLLVTALCVPSFPQFLSERNSFVHIYHGGWIDFNKNGKMDIYENPKADIDARVNNLIGQMNLDEKTCQLATLYGFGRVLKDELPTEKWKEQIWKDGIANIDEHLNGLDRSATQTQYSWPHSKHTRAINETQRFFVEDTRLGIPVDFTNEGNRGVCQENATGFPSQLGVGATWDVDLVRRIGEITGKEARILGFTNVYSPILDLARDPRWGRVVECYGEEPFLVSRLGVAQIKGLQNNGVVSTVKHFAVYSVPKGGRDGEARTDPQVTPREVESIYLMPFKAAFTEANALGTMSSYNDYNGVPVTGSSDFLINKLRKEWGFKGYVVSDSKAVEYIYTKHHVASDPKDAVRQAVMSGLNVRTEFTPPDDYILPLRELVKEGTVPVEVVDSRVADVLRVKFMLGLFDNPYTSNPDDADKLVGKQEHQAVSLEASHKSIVLAKNENNTLPLSKNIKSIFITGPNADAKKSSVSRYGPSKLKVISVLDGIKRKLSSDVKILYTKGCELYDNNFPESEIIPGKPTGAELNEIEKAAEMAKQADVSIVILGDDERIVGESRSRTSLDLPGYQSELVSAVYNTGKPTIVVLLSGRPMTINWINKYIPAVVIGWFPGPWGGDAIADVLFGDYNPGGKLPVTFPKSVGQLPYDFPYKPASILGDTSGVRGCLYPFGHGLSYTSFDYSGLKIRQAGSDTEVLYEVSFNIKNTGSRAGEEVVQLYVNDETSSVTTYVRNLRGFKRISLNSGESKEVTFNLGKEDLSLFNTDNQWVVENGKFNLYIGSSSENIRLEGSFDVNLPDKSFGVLK